ncbi:MAG: hypothetical protein DMG97_38530 [Acidobacteria bacterium]|nr:MAG: hypothetical protein DMG97_38530 [Acidobacteriota bacterium]
MYAMRDSGLHEAVHEGVALDGDFPLVLRFTARIDLFNLASFNRVLGLPTMRQPEHDPSCESGCTKIPG